MYIHLIIFIVLSFIIIQAYTLAFLSKNHHSQSNKSQKYFLFVYSAKSLNVMLSLSLSGKTVLKSLSYIFTELAESPIQSFLSFQCYYKYFPPPFYHNQLRKQDTTVTGHLFFDTKCFPFLYHSLQNGLSIL